MIESVKTNQHVVQEAITVSEQCSPTNNALRFTTKRSLVCNGQVRFTAAVTAANEEPFTKRLCLEEWPQSAR